MDNDVQLMQRALALANRGRSTTPPNPCVGCVVVNADTVVVGEGYHQRAGEAHAEVIALDNAGEQARGGTLYVTLEPCVHHGRTPPCVDAIITAGIRRVVIAARDPNPIAANGISRLTAAGIDCAVGICDNDAIALNRGFYARHQRGRPYVRLKSAMTLNGRIGSDAGGMRITGDDAWRDTQALRAISGAIITGIGTVRADNPRLDVRYQPTIDEALWRQPLKVVLAGRSAPLLPRNAALLGSGGETLVVADQRCCDTASHDGYQLRAVATVDGRIDLHALLALLADDYQINDVLIEAGTAVTTAALNAGIVDEWWLYIAPTLRVDATVPLINDISANSGYHIADMRKFGDDIRLCLHPQVMA